MPQAFPTPVQHASYHKQWMLSIFRRTTDPQREARRSHHLTCRTHVSETTCLLSCHRQTEALKRAKASRRVRVCGWFRLWIERLPRRRRQWLFVCNSNKRLCALCRGTRKGEKKKKFRKPHAMLEVMVCCVLGDGM